MKGFIEKWFFLIEINAFFSILITSIGITIYKKFDLENTALFLVNHTKVSLIITIIIYVILLFTLPFQKKQLNIAKEKININSRIYKIVYSIILIATLSLFLNFILQLFQMQLNIDHTILWIWNHKKAFLLGSILLFFIGLLILSIIGEIHISNFFYMSLVIILGLVHYLKLKFRGEPFYPADFRQITHLTDVSEMVFSFLSLPSIILIIVLLIIIIILLLALPKHTIKWSSRLVFFTIAISMTFSYFQYPKTFMKQVFAENLKTVGWNQVLNYEQNSAIMGFVLNFTSDSVDKPEDFSKQKVEEITNRIVKKTNTKETAFQVDLKEKPHIIFLMSEAFWDPTQIEELNFSEDPIPNIHSYMENYTSGHILTPMFGGGTANVEFEALTGFSMNFIKAGAVPYQSLFDKKSFVPSIVSQLEDDDYNTLAIHPYNGVFYKRNMVYNSLGFNKFFDMDTMKHQDPLGPYISDMGLTKEIIDQIQTSKKPTFIHAVSMQNHFSYVHEKYGENKIKVNGLTTDDAYQLEVYTEGLRNTDIATKKLIDYLDTIDKPVILVFWGDHLPILGNNKSVYKDINFANILENEQRNKEYYKTPFFIYTNYEIEHQSLGTMSPNYLGPLTFEMIGKKSPPYYQFLKEVYEEIPGLKNDIKLNHNEEVINELSSKQQELLNEYKIIQYDLLVDKQISSPKLFKVD